MKTSNKLLLAGYAFLLFCVFCLLSFVRLNATVQEHMNEAESDEYSQVAVSEFSHLEVGGVLRAYLVPSESTFLEANNSNERMGNFSYQIDGNKLTLDFEWNNDYKGHGVPKVRIGTGKLKAISLRGSAEMRSTSQLAFDGFSIAVTDGAEADLDLMADSISVELFAGSDLNLSGITDKLVLSCKSAGDLDARGLQVKDLVLAVSDACDIDVSVSNTAKGYVHDAGDVTCYGAAKTEVETSQAADFDIRSN